ncbi:MAG: TolC family protein [Candidatus Methylacidiphilales bacterium]|nr:TolC family protein [Candidatus Methylacidiphilales bacterium]
MSLSLRPAFFWAKRFNWVVFALFFPLAAQLQAIPQLPTKNGATVVYTLKDCLELGLSRNTDILRAEQDIERSQGLVITAKSLVYPKLTLNGRAEERNDDLFANGDSAERQKFREYWTVSVMATQSLYSGGANRQKIAISKLENAAALAQMRSVTNRVLRDIQHAVYEAVVQEALIEARKKTVALLADELQRQKQYFDAGKTTRFNVLRTQVSLSNQQVLLLEAQSELLSSRVRLSQLLQIEWPGDGASRPPFLLKEAMDCPQVTESEDQLVAMALSRRPELEVLRHEIEKSQRQVKVEKAANLPNIDAFAGYELRRDQNGSGLGDHVSAGAFGLLGTWNIFDGFSGKGKAISAEAALQGRRVSLDKTTLQVQSEVRDAYARLRTAGESVVIQKGNILTAEESVKLSRNSLDAGYATLLDVLQATLDLSTARLESVRARQRYMNALSDLQYAVSLQFQDDPAARTPKSPAEDTPVPAPSP